MEAISHCAYVETERLQEVPQESFCGPVSVVGFRGLFGNFMDSCAISRATSIDNRLMPESSNSVVFGIECHAKVTHGSAVFYVLGNGSRSN